MKSLQYRIHGVNSRFAISMLVLAMFACANASFAAPKTDILIFTNGDKLTGEVKSLKRGQLSFNTDATGTIGIEWDKVASLVSDQRIQVEVSNGKRYFGNLVNTEESSTVAVKTASGEEVLSSRSIIQMTPIEERGLSALDVDVSLGYNFAKAGGVKQANLGIDVDYRTLLRIYSLDISTIISDSGEQDASQRKNLGLQYTRLRGNRWFYNGDLNLEQNDELGLDLRTSLGAGIGRALLQTDHMILRLQGGLLVSRENVAETDEDTESLEGQVTVDWDWFRFENPELDWSTTFQVIPSLTESGRVRTNFDTRLRWDIIGDLNWQLSFYHNYDSDPQSETAAGTDYGVNTTLVYDF